MGKIWLASACIVYGLAASASDAIVEYVEADAQSSIELAQSIWEFAELGYLEERSSLRLQRYLGERGFSIEAPVAGMPTAFVASYGQGKPVIGILAEFDALPGLSQAAQPSRAPINENAPGHACGHHLFGAASVAAGVAVVQWLEASGQSGTVRVYGTPAEEGGSGKVYMTRVGLFEDVDVVLHWHPSDRNSAAPSSSTANKSGRFTFHGIAAHAAAAPDRGRSALDGVESMNYMVNLMREHVPSDTRIHYVITDGGDAPNIVPETAQVFYYVRHPKVARVIELFERVVTAGRAAALGTDTRMDYEVIHGNYPLLPNDALARIVDRNLRILGGISYDAAETRFAEEIRSTLLGEVLPLASAAEVQPFVFRQGMGSTDVGDVSWNVPTVGFGTATWVPGTPAHSWQAVAAGGTSIGHKGMLLAAKLLALTAQNLFEDPALIKAAAAELKERQGLDFDYSPLLGDRAPPLDYRL
ncbi:MAG: amidohydrolase [Gammaproteobacteria bacterium]|nr:amidohydrolase [Gammaproteobacteria bacterium]